MPIAPPDPSTGTLRGASALWSGLLGYFYHRRGLALPTVTFLDPAEVPPPFRDLLVHEHDMTPTLDRFFRQPVHLNVLLRHVRLATYLREVTLQLGDGTPVEYGVILINLSHFTEHTRQMVLAGQLPFGRILHREAIPHYSVPQTFFQVPCDAHMRSVLKLSGNPMLYGRMNVLLTGGQFLANVIEIVAPVPQIPKPIP